jgi:hypothetical protein
VNPNSAADSATVVSAVSFAVLGLGLSVEGNGEKVENTEIEPGIGSSIVSN